MVRCASPTVRSLGAAAPRSLGDERQSSLTKDMSGGPPPGQPGSTHSILMQVYMIIEFLWASFSLEFHIGFF